MCSIMQKKHSISRERRTVIEWDWLRQSKCISHTHSFALSFSEFNLNNQIKEKVLSKYLLFELLNQQCAILHSYTWIIEMLCTIYHSAWQFLIASSAHFTSINKSLWLSDWSRKNEQQKQQQQATKSVLSKPTRITVARWYWNGWIWNV